MSRGGEAGAGTAAFPPATAAPEAPETLRVLILTNLYPSPQQPGRGPFIRSQVGSLEQAGIEVDLMVIDGWRSRLEYLRAGARLRARVKQRPFDLIHAHYGYSGWVALMQNRLPIVISFLGDDVLGTPRADGGFTLSSRILRSINRRLARRYAGVIVKSEQMRRALGGIDAAVIPNGVDLGLFRPKDREECRRHLGLPLQGIRLLFAGDPSIARKRHPLAVRAAVILGRRLAPVELHAVWGRPQDELVEWMNACDALLLTSWTEGSPNVVKEAMACNLPVVATAAGDVPDLLSRCEGNRLIPIRGSEAELAVELARGLEEVVRRGRTRCREAMGDLSLDAVAARVRRVYEGCLAARRGRVPRHRRG